ncbi:MAG: MarR family transcriptional regulator [Burkholderiales bacterium]|nr:MarR family transcriptional regulator [Burkholderiales bacterium]
MKKAAVESSPHPDQIATLRAFSRFYTQRIGVLHEQLLGSGFNLAQSRVLWELAHLPEGSAGISAAALAQALGLDAGYLSRLLATMTARKLIKRTPSPTDGRQRLISLSPAGKRAFAPLDSRSQAQMSELLSTLPPAERLRLVAALRSAQSLMGARPETAAGYLLRSQRPGDIGWVIGRHGALYAREYRWDMRFEALVAHIAARFIEQFDGRREACWIAERPGLDGQGENIGCVFLAQARDEHTGAPEAGTAQLRLLLVEPSARGSGLGARLVAECTRFARQAGYQRIRLWTQSCLIGARAIYAKQGYALIGTEPHHSFGHALVGEVWELPLA